MKKKKGFLKTYLLLALIFGLYGLLDSVLTFFNVLNNIYVYLAFILPFLFFVFSIIAIPIFHHQRLERIVYVLPIYHILSYLIFFAFAFILSFFWLVHGWIWILIIILGFLTSIFEIWFSYYLLKRFELF